MTENRWLIIQAIYKFPGFPLFRIKNAFNPCNSQKEKFIFDYSGGYIYVGDDCYKNEAETDSVKRPSDERVSASVG